MKDGFMKLRVSKNEEEKKKEKGERKVLILRVPNQVRHRLI
jgi:hypothetical protein